MTRRVGVLVCVAVLVLSGTMASKAEPPEETAETLVVMKLVVPGGESVTVGVPVGRLATYEDLQTGLKFGLRPVSADMAENSADVEVVSLEGNGGRYEQVSTVETLEAALGHRAVAAGVDNQAIDVTVVQLVASRSGGEAAKNCVAPASVDISQGQGRRVKEAIEQEFESEGCCVVCGSKITCGCYVSAGCGGPCCGCSSCGGG